MTDRDYSVEAQVAEFFAERGLQPIVVVRRKGPGSRLHATYEHDPTLRLCNISKRNRLGMRYATWEELRIPLCTRCHRSYIGRLLKQRLQAIGKALDES